MYLCKKDSYYFPLLFVVVIRELKVYRDKGRRSLVVLLDPVIVTT